MLWCVGCHGQPAGYHPDFVEAARLAHLRGLPFRRRGRLFGDPWLLSLEQDAVCCQACPRPQQVWGPSPHPSCSARGPPAGSEVADLILTWFDFRQTGCRQKVANRDRSAGPVTARLGCQGVDRRLMRPLHERPVPHCHPASACLGRNWFWWVERPAYPSLVEASLIATMRQTSDRHLGLNPCPTPRVFRHFRHHSSFLVSLMQSCYLLLPINYPFPHERTRTISHRS